MKKAILPFIVLFAAPDAMAHGIKADIKVEKVSLGFAVKYSGGDLAANLPYWVVDASDEVLLSGQTDSQGGFSFSPDLAQPLRVIVKDAMGHRVRTEITPESVIGLLQSGQFSAGQAPEAESVPEARSLPTAAPRSEGVPWKNLFSGFGYIFGLAGMAIWLLQKKKEEIHPA